MPATLTPPAPEVRPTRSAPAVIPSKIPPLRNGDRLTAPEYLRRYEAMPEHVKAELIDGRVYIVNDMASPVSLDEHASPVLDLGYWISTYRELTPGLRTGADATVELDLRNLPQPDLLMLIPHDKGGQARTGVTRYVTGAPELVCEIAASTVNYDLHEKLETYRRNRVREYVVWRTEDREIDYFVLRDGNYERRHPGDDGLYRSEVFPGLWLDPEAVFRSDLTGIANAVRKGCATPEHAAFAERVKP